MEDWGTGSLPIAFLTEPQSAVALSDHTSNIHKHYSATNAITQYHPHLSSSHTITTMNESETTVEAKSL